jgi:hypothetical protein
VIQPCRRSMTLSNESHGRWISAPPTETSDEERPIL